MVGKIAKGGLAGAGQSSAGGLIWPAPNWLERRAAALTARRIISAKPPAPISTSSAAAVVPPGEVTAWRKAAGSLPPWRNNSPAPATVSQASLRASSGVNPSAMPAAIMVSASKKT